MVVKPSTWFVFFFHITIQWASFFHFEYVYMSLKEPYIYYTLSNIVPLSILIISRKVFRSIAKKTWIKLQDAIVNYEADNNQNKRLMKITLSLSLMIILIYFQYVPFKETGLYISFTETDLLLISLARENSSKLLEQQWLKYLEVFFEKFLAPLSASLLILTILKNLVNKNRIWVLINISILILLVIAAALPGARINGVLVILSSTITLLFMNRGRIKLLKLIYLFLIILLPAILIEISKNKETGIQGFELLKLGFEEIFIRRIFFVPTEVSVFWLQHVEKYGFWGIGGLEKIASLVGVEPIHVPNLLANYFWSLDPNNSAYLSTGFIISHYCYFGLSVVPFMVLGVLLLDTWVIFYKILKRYLILPAIVSLNMACISLTESDYLTIFVTYGFLTGLIFILFINFYSNKIVVNIHESTNVM